MVSGETADGASLAVCLHQVFVKILKGGVRVLIIDCSAVSTLFVPVSECDYLGTSACR